MEPEKRIRKPKLGKELKRTVPVLFPRTRAELTEEQVRGYATHLPYAFGIDRQSEHLEMTRAEATGCERRVSAIEAAAREARLFLPRPEPKEKRRDGDLPYLFDEQYWFVDGMKRKATGYAASQNARPRLWDAFLLAQALAERGVGPRMFIIGEATRFFREERWLTEFVHSLWNHDIKIYVCGFAEVNRHTLPGLIAYINALSGWLPMVRAGARESRRGAHRLWTAQLPVGLRSSGLTGEEPPETRSHVWTDADTWPALARMIAGMADGSLTSYRDASEYLMAHEGMSLSTKWVHKWLNSGTPEGIYLAYHRRHRQRILEQAGGLFHDLDIRESGARRYLVEEQPGIEFEVRYSPGTAPIDPEAVAAARARVTRHIGRPSSDARKWADVILPTRLTECAVCGASLSVQPPREAGGTAWWVRCNKLHRVRMNERCSMEDARAYIAEHCPHQLSATVNLGELVWETVVNGLTGAPITTQEPTSDEAADKRKAQHLLEQAEADFEAFQQRCYRGECGDQTKPLIRRSTEAERDRLMAVIEERQNAFDRLASRRANAQQQQLSRARLAAILRHFHRVGVTQAEKRELLEAIVTNVEVHLEERWFKVEVNVPWPTFRQLQGRWGEPDEMETSCSSLYHFTGCLQGSWAA